MSKPLITLKKLHEEGKLSIGDTLYHSELGDFKLLGVQPDGSLYVGQGSHRTFWKLDLPEGCKIVPVATK